MTHDELLALIEPMTIDDAIFMKDALRAVVELHKPVLHSEDEYICEGCNLVYPCDTIETIEKELQ